MLTDTTRPRAPCDTSSPRGLRTTAWPSRTGTTPARHSSRRRTTDSLDVGVLVMERGHRHSVQHGLLFGLEGAAEFAKLLDKDFPLGFAWDLGLLRHYLCLPAYPGEATPRAIRWWPR